MPNRKNRAGKKALKRLKMATDDTLVQNDHLIRKISLSAPTTKITLNPSKSVGELTENFEANKDKEKTETCRRKSGNSEGGTESRRQYYYYSC